MGILRVILALSVVIHHYHPIFGIRFVGGGVAVETFFIISGFYMTMILDKKYTGKGSYKLFISNRFLRIFPIYWVILALTIVTYLLAGMYFNTWFALAAYKHWFDIMSIETLLYLITTHVILFGQDIAMFLGMSPQDGTMFFTTTSFDNQPIFYGFLLVPQAWTLGIELLFYVLAPLIVRRKTSIIILIVTSSVVLRGYIHFVLGWSHDPWTIRFFPSEMALFLFGTISYRIYTRIKNKENIKQIALLISMVFIMVTSLYQFIPTEYLKRSIYYMLACFSLPFIFYLTRNSTIDSRIGELSYPIYLSHLLVIEIFNRFLTGYHIQAYKGVQLVILTILVSAVLVKLISDPIEKIRQSRVAQRG